MSEVLSPPPTARRSRLRTFAKYAGIALIVLAAGLFFARRQIGNMLARQLDERLSAAGIYVAWHSADWVPGPGIRLHGLALYRDAAKQDRIALLGNVTAFKGSPGWSQWDMVRVDMDNAELTLASGAAETRVEHMELRLLIQPGRGDLEECHASLQGLRIEANGSYVRAAAPAAAAAAPADMAAKPAAQNVGLFDDINLDWLKSVKEWVKFQPEKDEPVLRLKFHSLPDGSAMDLAATLDGRMFQWRGQKWDLMQAAVKTSLGDKPSPVEIDQVRLGHAGQTCEIKGTFDPARDVLRIGRFDSGIDVLALARALVPDAVADLAAVTTTGGWRISGDGEVPLDHPENIRWKGGVALDGDLIYAAGGKRVALQKPALAVQMAQQLVTVSDFKAGLWGGNLNVPLTQIHLPSAGSKPRFDTQVTLRGAGLQSVMNSFAPAQRQPGVVDFNWKGGGGFELASITGSGTLGIHDAEFYRIPLLGPLHVVFDKLTPGFARDVASTLTAGHRIGGGIFYIDKLNLESRLTRIEANGSVDLSREYARLTARAKLQGIVGLATSLLSALLEVEGEGPVGDVRWKLKNIPGAALIGDAVNVVGKTGGAVIEGAGTAAKKSAGAATGVLEGAGKAAKGLFKLLPGSR